MNSLNEKKILESEKVNRYKNVNCHHLRIEIYDKDLKNILETKKFNYFSGFKNYFKDMETHGKEPILYSFYEYFGDEFNINSELMDNHETVKTVILTHYKKEEEAQELYQLLNQEHMKSYSKFHRELEILHLDQSKINVNEKMENLLNNEKFLQILERVDKKQDWLDQEEDVNEDKVFIAQLDMKCIPLIPHLGIVLAILKSILVEEWIMSKDFKFKKLVEFIRNHLLESLKIFDAEFRMNFLGPHLLKISLGDDCDQNEPEFDHESNLYNIFDKYDMVIRFIKNFKGGRRKNKRNTFLGDSGISPEKDLVKFKEIKIYYLSWNLAGFFPNTDDIEECKVLLNNLFKKMDDPDLIVFSLQELIELKVKPELMTEMFSNEIKAFKTWTRFIRLFFLMIFDNYVCAVKQNLLGLGIFVFVNKRIYSKIGKIFVKKIKFGLLGALPNKGSILVRMKIFNSVIVFANTHLPSGEKNDKIKARSSKVEEIVSGAENDKKFNYDVMFISGDLNLRCYGNFPFDERRLEQLKFLMKSESNQKRIEEYQQSDEVKKELHSVLGVKFLEGELPSLPTYKVKKGSNEPKYKENRRPSWTDRIFFHVKDKSLKIKNTKTDSFYIPQSDHL